MTTTHPPHLPCTPLSPAPARRAFTLIEMIIVVLILAVLIAILIPAVAGVNRAAKKTSSAALMNQLGTATQQFKIDNNRQPGYFSAADIGSIANNPRGFTAMENIMLDLAGGVVGPGDDPPAGFPANTSIIRVGPHDRDETKQVFIDVNLIGTPAANANNQAQMVGSTGAYFVPDPKHFVVQRAARANTPNVQPGDALKKVCNAAAHYRIPDVVDSFGSPLLAWVEDESPNTDVDFVAVQNQTNTRARFYWVSNAAFLRAQSLGKIGNDQRVTVGYSGDGPPFSLIGAVNNGNLRTPEGLRMMEALLGNKAYPDEAANPPVPALGAPAAARGKVIFHSAGSDGYYMGSRETGGKIALGHVSAGNRTPYNPHAGDMPPTAPKEDAMARFDDILTVAGN